MRLIQFIPVMQSTSNSQSSHNCPFRPSQTKMCCWIQVSFSSQIKILCDLHNLFNTDLQPDPSFTSPFFCQQENISSLKTDLQPRQVTRQPRQRRVESKVYFTRVRKNLTLKKDFTIGSHFGVTVRQPMVKMWQNSLGRQKLVRSESKRHAKQTKWAWKRGIVSSNKITVNPPMPQAAFDWHFIVHYFKSGLKTKEVFKYFFLTLLWSKGTN